MEGADEFKFGERRKRERMVAGRAERRLEAWRAQMNINSERGEREEEWLQGGWI